MISDPRSIALVGKVVRTARRGGLLAVALVAVAALLAACTKVPLEAPTGTTITLYTNAQVLPLNGTTTITANVRESGGYPVQNGTVVNFVSTLGTVTPSQSETTDGKITVTFNAGPVSGTAVINAYSGSSTTTSSTSTTTGGTTAGASSGSGVSIIVGAAAVATVIATSSPSTVTQMGGSSIITATVLDTNNNALSGIPVAFTTDQGSLAPVTATTNASGVATSTLTTNQTATVTVTAGTKTATAKVTATALPTLTLTGPTTTTTAGIAAVFSVNATAGSGSAPIRSVVIDFGDGGFVNLGAATGSVSVPHTYLQAATYTATATATDASGASTTVSTPIVVYASTAFQLTVTAPSGRVAQPITVTVTTSAGAPTVNSYTYNFGDGTIITTSVPSASHVYSSPLPGGAQTFPFTITVTAQGSDGRTGVGSTTITIAL